MTQRRAPRKLIAYTDGGSRGNPGPAAIGVVLQDENGNVLKTHREYLGKRTNNEAEYEAVIAALKKTKALFGKTQTSSMALEIRTDSKLLAEQLSDHYKITQEHIGHLYLRVRNLKLDFASFSVRHIPREENQAADRLVNEELDALRGQLPQQALRL